MKLHSWTARMRQSSKREDWNDQIVPGEDHWNEYSCLCSVRVGYWMEWNAEDHVHRAVRLEADFEKYFQVFDGCRTRLE